MNGSFEEYKEKKIICDDYKLDAAILAGVDRAKRNRPDFFKIFVSFSATAAVFLIVAIMWFNESIVLSGWEIFLRGSIIDMECSIALQGYINEAIQTTVELIRY